MCVWCVVCGVCKCRWIVQHSDTNTSTHNTQTEVKSILLSPTLPPPPFTPPYPLSPPPTWFSALNTVDGEVPPHTAALTASDPHVPVPRNTQPRLIAKLPQTTRLGNKERNRENHKVWIVPMCIGQPVAKGYWLELPVPYH